jgi:oligoribonuclease
VGKLFEYPPVCEAKFEAGPYHAPAVNVGAILRDEYLNKDVTVEGRTAAPIPWPGRSRGKPIHELPVYHRLVYHKEYRGSAYALAMNANLLRHLSGEREPWWRDPDQVADDFAAWLRDACGWDGKTALAPAGKNFASFDRQFLRRLPRFEQVMRLSHRTIDPAILFLRPDDEKLPDSKTCYERAGLDSKVAHTAVEDALAVVRLIRQGIKHLRGMHQ